MGPKTILEPIAMAGGAGLYCLSYQSVPPTRSRGTGQFPATHLIQNEGGAILQGERREFSVKKRFKLDAGEAIRS